MTFNIKSIGTIHTPYTEKAPYQPVEEDEGNFYITVKKEYEHCLFRLNSFKYIYVIYYIHKLKRKKIFKIMIPPWTEGFKIGLFASRSPLRPNPIGLSIVKIKGIVKNIIYTSGLDVFDGTPLIDIKPYVKNLDSKCDANYGWIDQLGDLSHLVLHIQGIPHDY